MPDPIQARWPIGGVSEDLGFSDQSGKTCQRAQNVRGIDPVTGRLRGAVRSGTSRYCDTIIAASKVAHIGTIATANTNQTIVELGDAPLGTPTQTWKKTNTVTGATIGVACGTQGDVYSLDGNVGVMKRNADGLLLWKITLAAEDKDHVCRALLVDSGVPDNAGTDTVLVGVSTGGDSTLAKFWAYIQLNDNKVQKLWELSPGGYIEEFTISKDKLFVLMNFPDQNRAYVVVYDDYLTNSPTEVNRWAVPYPAHSIATGPSDGYIFTASAPNSNRDVFYGHPKATWASEDWTAFDLSSYKERLWCNLDASKVETLSISPRDLAYPNNNDGTDDTSTAPPPDLLDGGDVRMWVDDSGRGRNFYQTADFLPQLNAAGTLYALGTHAAPRGAIYKAKGGPNGLPCLHFDGATCGMISEAPSSKDKANRSDNLSVLPSYKGAQFACFMVVRASNDEFRRVVLTQGGDKDSNSNVARFIAINSDVGRTISSSVGGADSVNGQIHVWEPNGGLTGASDAGSCTVAAPALTGTNGYALGGALSESGFAVITWVCDGGVHDTFGTATRSLFRVNGHPCDRWQSAAFSTILPTQLGYMPRATPGTLPFAGDVCQITVIHDWFNASDTQQALLQQDTGAGTAVAMSYPDTTHASGQDSEIERIEGWLAHKWGMAHELPGGRVSWLTLTGNPAAANTLVIGSTTYTFRAALTPAVNEILIGSTNKDTAINIVSAVNKTGDPGTTYDRRTVVNAEFRAFGPVAVNSTVDYAICFRTRNPNDFTSVVSETMANATFDNTTPQASKAGSGGNRGWYPHPFYIEKTATTAGGPPRTAGAATISKYWLLRSPYGILAAWDPASGKAKSVISSNYDGAGAGLGGIGYGVRVASTGEVYSCGPRQAAVAANTSFSPSAITVDPYDLRKIIFEQETFSPTTGDYWRVTLSATTYTYPRMAVDKYDNLFFPAANTSLNAVYAYNRAAGLVPGDSDILFSYSIPTTNNDGYCVAIDPTYPDFTGYTSFQRAEHFILGTSVSGGTRESVFKIKTISITQAVGTPRTIVAIAVAGSQVSKFTTAAVTPVTLTDSVSVSSARNAVFSAPLFNKLYLVDGNETFVYDPATNAMAIHRGTSSGGVPKRCQLIETWNGSLVLARQAENPNQYWISGQGDAGNWDTQPYTINQAQAIMGSDGSAGLPPDIVNAFIPYNDDLAFIGGDHSIYRLTGRPSPGSGGEIHLVSSTIGIAFGRAWCKDPRGIIYFVSSRGSVYRIVPGSGPEPLSGERKWRSGIERRLQAINLAAYTIQMAWSDQDKGFHLILSPFGAGGTIMEHYFWEEAHGAWWPDKWASTGIQPTCIAIMDGDAASDRVVLVGGEDGYIRKFDKAAVADATAASSAAIDAFVLIGPLVSKDVGMEVMFSRLQAVMANDQEGRPFVNVYVTDRADYLSQPVWSGQILPGRNLFANFKRRGSFVYIEISSSDPNARWAYEQISVDYAAPAGIKRSLGA